MKKIAMILNGLAIALMVVLISGKAVCQQTNPDTVNVNWQQFANDTTLTFQQIVTSCDSLFGLAGINAGNDTAQAPPESDNNSYENYTVRRPNHLVGTAGLEAGLQTGEAQNNCIRKLILSHD